MSGSRCRCRCCHLRIPCPRRHTKDLVRVRCSHLLRRWYMRPFMRQHSSDEAMALIRNPPHSAAEATAAFLEGAESESLVERRAEHTDVDKQPDARSHRWPPFADVMRCPEMLGSKVVAESPTRRSKSEKRWEVALEAAVKAPELLFADEPQKRACCFCHPNFAYAAAFSELGLEDWRRNFRLQDALATGGLCAKAVADCDARQRTLPGCHEEVANLQAPLQHVKHLEFKAQFADGAGNGSLSHRRLCLLRGRLQRGGVDAGVGSRRFAIGAALSTKPSFQRTCSATY